MHIGVPADMKSAEMQKVKVADAEKLREKYSTLGDIAALIGAKKKW